MTVWITVAAALLILLITRIIFECKSGKDTEKNQCKTRRCKILEIGNEREEFFVAGDAPFTSKNDDYDQYYD